ncbi:PREDICTED: uncharacterized protein LOC105146856 [Acromyrmex echinatior]|uniref:uncharacterized protein LOC105146856 n=1 Tax=Acromyrmex echinatior TaxID=103372 RepID=UPI000580F8E5|nr:PREDICTED: uncharacterized protein LOC105146856 [Acromyrmex echinatior]
MFDCDWLILIITTTYNYAYGCCKVDLISYQYIVITQDRQDVYIEIGIVGSMSRKDRLVVNERPSIHEEFRVNGTQSWITGCTGKPEMGSRMTSSGFNSVYSTPRNKLGY